MLEVCQQKAEIAGVSQRCRFHEGTIDSLPADVKYHAATAILVSQFLPEAEKRTEFFREIRKRLHAGAYFINADLTSPDQETSYDKLIKVWTKMLMLTGLGLEAAKASTLQWKKIVAVSKTQEIERFSNIFF